MFRERGPDRVIRAVVFRRFSHGDRKTGIESRNEIFQFLDRRAFRAGFCENKNLHFFLNSRTEFRSGRKSVAKL